MIRAIIGEIFSSGRATLYKNPSDQTVQAVNRKLRETQQSRDELRTQFDFQSHEPGLVVLEEDFKLRTGAIWKDRLSDIGLSTCDGSSLRNMSPGQAQVLKVEPSPSLGTSEKVESEP